MPIAGRRRAESLMTTQVTVSRTSGSPDPVSGESPRATVYSGRSKLQSYEGYEGNPVVGQKVETVQRMSLHFPVGSFVMAVGDLATVTGSTDALMVGRVFRLVQVAPYKEHATAYRVFVEEVTA